MTEREYQRQRKRRENEQRIEAENRRARFCQRRHGAGICGGRLETVMVLGGSLSVRCERCERFKAGICACCPRPVVGAVRRARFCADCRVRSRRAAWRRDYYGNLDERRRSGRMRERRRRERLRAA